MAIITIKYKDKSSGNTITKTLPEPKNGGIVITDEPVWDESTTRDTTGKMTGHIIAFKKTVAVTWPPLTFSQAKLIRDTVMAAGKSGSYFQLTYPDTGTTSDGETTVEYVTITCYSGNLTRTIYSLAKGYEWQDGATITFIEQ